MKKKILCAIICCIFLSGCSWSKGEKNISLELDNTKESEEANLKAGDFVVFLGLDTKQEKIIVQRVAGGNKYSLSYSGTTNVKDRFGQIISMTQIQPGELVDIVYSAQQGSFGSQRFRRDLDKYRNYKIFYR